MSVNESMKSVSENLIMHGFLEIYTIWNQHGETPKHQQNPTTENLASETNMEDDMEGLVHDTFGYQGLDGEYVDENHLNILKAQMKELREKVRAEYSAKIQQETNEMHGELREKLRGEMNGMMQEMKSQFAQM